MTEYLAMTPHRLLNGRRRTVTHGSPDKVTTYCGREITQFFIVFDALTTNPKLSCSVCTTKRKAFLKELEHAGARQEEGSVGLDR